MDFYEALLNTSNQCGLKVLSDDFCCKLLAWLYVFGGGNEMVLYNKKLRTEIQHAQKRLNIFGGECVNKDLLELLQQRTKECGGDALNPILPEWIDEIDKRYGIKSKKEKHNEHKDN